MQHYVDLFFVLYMNDITFTQNVFIAVKNIVSTVIIRNITDSGTDINFIISLPKVINRTGLIIIVSLLCINLM